MNHTQSGSGLPDRLLAPTRRRCRAVISLQATLRLPPPASLPGVAAAGLSRQANWLDLPVAGGRRDGRG